MMKKGADCGFTQSRFLKTQIEVNSSPVRVEWQPWRKYMGISACEVYNM